jgi:hypothetical protein
MQIHYIRVVTGAHASATGLLAGLAWTVQGVVYPALRLVPDESWPSYHAQHSKAITRVLVLPWSAQLATGVFLLARPAVSTRMAVSDALLNLMPLAATATVGIRLHRRLARSRTEHDIHALLALNLLRALAWTAATGTALSLLTEAADGAGRKETVT